MTDANQQKIPTHELVARINSALGSSAYERRGRAALEELVEQLEAHRSALERGYELIWMQDAPWIEGGAERLDSWAHEVGLLLKRPASELAEPGANRVSIPARES